MKFLYLLGIIVSSYYFIRWRNKTQKLLLVYSSNKLSKLFHLVNIKYFVSLKRPLLLFSGHIQTFLIEIFNILVRLLRKILKLSKFRYEREIFDLSDGAKIAIDHAKPRGLRSAEEFQKERNKEKILLIVPGITSTSDDLYVRQTVEEFFDEYDCRVINARGFAGIKLYSPVLICPYLFHDIGEYVRKICEENQNKKVFAVGFSYGGYLLSRYLGFEPKNVPKNFYGGCGICYPVDLQKSSEFCENTFNGIYMKGSLNAIKQVFFDNLENIFNPKKCKKEILEKKEFFIKIFQKTQHLSEIDIHYNTKVLGFDTVEDYFEYSNSEKFLANINVPFLSWFTEDDPIIPIKSIPFKVLQANSNCVTVVTEHGGHLGFFDGMISPRRMVNEPIRNFLSTVEILREN